MICSPLSEEPSLSSMNEKAFESRRVRTHPWRWMASIGPAALRASLTRVRGIGGGERKQGAARLANRENVETNSVGNREVREETRRSADRRYLRRGLHLSSDGF